MNKGTAGWFNMLSAAAALVMGCAEFTQPPQDYMVWNCGANGARVTATLLSYGTLTVIGLGDMEDYTLTNPAPWEDYKSSITRVLIDYGVRSVGKQAFKSCTNMTSVTLPDGVTSIGEQAFRFCVGLTSVTIPNSVTSIGNRAFINCTGLKSVTLSNRLISIESTAFANCRSLTSITLPNSVTHIGERAFADCVGLTIKVPKSVKCADNAFEGCHMYLKI